MERLVDPANELIAILPIDFREYAQSFDLTNLIEIVADYDRPLELRFPDRFERSNLTITDSDIRHILNHQDLTRFGTDNRAGIKGTLHRVSRILDRNEEVVGLTMRCGRIIENSIELIADLLDSGEGVLFIGAPGTGKTSIIRQACRYLSDAAEKRVVIVDTSMEIGGDGKVPHKAVGSSRRMPVKQRNQQYDTMVEGVQNHFPEVLVVDEIGTQQEAQACCMIAERGMQLIASIHGKSLESVINTPKLRDILGRVDSAAVSDKNAEKSGEKFVTRRLNEPAFGIAVEVLGFGKLAIHRDVKRSVDAYLSGETLRPEQRWLSDGGEVLHRDEMFGDSPLRDLSRFSARE